jgi:hypothetical protein
MIEEYLTNYLLHLIEHFYFRVLMANDYVSYGVYIYPLNRLMYFGSCTGESFNV